MLLTHLVRDPVTARAVTGKLDDHFFDPVADTITSVCWLTARDSFHAKGIPVDQTFFRAKVLERLAEDYPDNALPPEYIDDFITRIFRPDQACLNFELIRETLDRMISERVIADDVQSLMYSRRPPAEVLADMAAKLSQHRIATTVLDSFAGARSSFSGMKRTPSGSPIFDKLFSDGQQRGFYKGQSIGLLGPMKGGKSTLAYTLVADFISCTDRVRRATFVTYEESAYHVIPKLVVACAKVSRKLVMGVDIPDMPVEVQARVMDAIKLLDERVNFLDMSGSHFDQGKGGVDELYGKLDELYRAGKLGELVVVDHCGPLVRSSQANLEHTRQEIVRTCTEFNRAMLTFGIAGLLLHQMDAKGNTGGARVRPTHLNAAECKHFAEILSDCLVLEAKPSPTDNITRLALSATRTLEPDMIFVRIDGDRCRIELETRKTHFDTRTRTFQEPGGTNVMGQMRRIN